MKEKQLISEIQRNLQIMGVDKKVRIYENNETKYRIVLNEGIGGIGSEIAQWLKGTSRQVIEEIPGLLDQYGNKVTKIIHEIGNYRIADDIFKSFEDVCNGTKKLTDLGDVNAKMFLDLLYEMNPSIITKFYDDVMKQASTLSGKRIEDIVKALKKNVDEGSDLDSEILNMCGGDELLASVLKKEFVKRMDEVTFVPFRGTFEDSIRAAFNWKWNEVINNLPIEKTVVNGIKNFLSSDGWIRQMRGVILHMWNGWTKNQDELIEEALNNLQVIFSEVLSGSKKDLKTQFRKLNITLDSIDPAKLEEIQNLFIEEIKKLEFNVGGQNRKLTENEIKTIKDGFVNNKVFGEDIGIWSVEAFNKSYLGKHVNSLFKITKKGIPEWLSRTYWWFLTTTSRKFSDWIRIARERKILSNFGSMWVVATGVHKLLFPAIAAFFGGIIDTAKAYGVEGDNRDGLLEYVWSNFIKQIKEAWAPNDSVTANIIEVIVPFHAIPAVALVSWINEIRDDKVNMDDSIEKIKEKYPNLSNEQLEKFKVWWERNKDVSIDNIENLEENLNNLGSTEEGFRAYCTLKNYDFLGFNPGTEIGTANVPNEGQKKFAWSDQYNDFMKMN